MLDTISTGRIIDVIVDLEEVWHDVWRGSSMCKLESSS